MDGGNGMVAVVRGLRDAGLAVTLLDSGKQYTLVPNSVLHQATRDSREYSNLQRSAATDATNRFDPGISCDSGAQAVDGRYASVYKTTHCKVKPTSPPLLLTEFPPQRSEVCPGHDNFEVGGTGSGDTNFNAIRANGTFRGGGLIWSDRGSVCSPRPSREPDAFANSLRKYPAVSPDRSTEIVERLITYTQAKNFAKSSRLQFSSSPTRNGLDTNYSDQILDRGSTRAVNKPRAYDEVKSRPKMYDDSPTREKSKRTDYEYADYRRPIFCKNYDVKYLRDMSRRVRDNIRSMSSYVPYHQPACPIIRERYEVMPDKKLSDHTPSNMVNTEIQASAQMVCREVATVPRLEPSKRNVAVPLSPTSSESGPTHEGGVLLPSRLSTSQQVFKSVQTTLIPLNLPITIRKSVQTTLSSIEIAKPGNFNAVNIRRSRSEEELKVNKDLQDEILECLEDILCNPDDKIIRDDVLEKLSIKLKRFSKSLDSDGEKTKMKLEKCFKESSLWYKDYDEDITAELINKMRYKPKFSAKIYRAEIVPYKICDDFKNIIRDWLNELPIKNHDFLGRLVEKEQILSSFIKRLKRALSRPECDRKKLRGEIIEILDEIPIDIHGCHNKRVYLNKIANILMDKLRNINSTNHCKNFPNNKAHCNDDKRIPKCTIQPTTDELKDFVKDEMVDFLDKFHLEMESKQIEEMETELVDVLADSIDSIRCDNDDHVKEEIVSLLRDSGEIFEHQAMYLANLMLDHLKEMFNVIEESHRSLGKGRLETYMVMNSSVQSQSMNETDFSIGGITEGDIQANLDVYLHKLSEHIEDWLTSLNVELPKAADDSFKHIVVNDLAGDIVDRHKYLELNPGSRGSDQDELENLKYQIFKWINKLVGEDHTETIENAPDLMRRIRSVPVPMLTRPNASMNASGGKKGGAGGSSGQQAMYGSGGSIMDSTQGSRRSGPDGHRNPCCEESLNRIPAFGPDGSVIQSPRDQSPLRQFGAGGGYAPTMGMNQTFGAPSSGMADSVRRSSLGGNVSGPGGYSAPMNATMPYMSTGGGMAEPMRRTSIGQGGYAAPMPPMSATMDMSQAYGPSSAIAESPRKASRIANLGEPGGFIHGPMNMSQMPMFGPAGPGGSMRESSREESPTRRYSVPSGFTPAPMSGSGQMPMYASPADTLASGSPDSRSRSSSLGGISMRPAAGATAAPTGNLRQPVGPPGQTVKELSEEYDNFVKNWVQEIPIASSNSEEKQLAETMRTGLYNGVWKAITKLKCQPQIMMNPFHYEDAFDDEIEQLYGMLPQTPELDAKKHLLKVQLIEKTSQFNELIKMFFAPETFKQDLVEKVEVYVPRLSTDNREENPVKLYEDVQVLYLVEDFILFTRFKDDDPIKSNAYRKKLLQRAQEFVDELKKIHGTELKNINEEMYVNDILSALNQVPLPGETTLRDEADEILIGLEIEQWYADLPIAHNDNITEQLKRRRLRDGLAKKIHEMEKSMNLSDSNGERELRGEVSKFLDRMPLGRDESLNINYMVDDLTNRMKNRVRERAAEGNGKRKSVMFQDTVVYDEFSQNVPGSSSFAQGPNAGGRSGLGPFGGNLHGPLLPCCEPFSSPCCKEGEGQPNSIIGGGNISQMQSSGYQPQMIQSPPTYGSFEMRQPMSSSMNGYNMPQVGDVSIVQGSTDTNFHTLLDSRGPPPQMAGPAGPSYTMSYNSDPGKSFRPAQQAAPMMPQTTYSESYPGQQSFRRPSLQGAAPPIMPAIQCPICQTLESSGAGQQSRPPMAQQSIAASFPQESMAPPQITAGGQPPITQSFGSQPSFGMQQSMMQGSPPPSRRQWNDSQVTGGSQGPYPPTSVVQDPGSYGAFDFERPISSSFSQSQTGQGQQYYTIPDSRGASPVRRLSQSRQEQPQPAGGSPQQKRVSIAPGPPSQWPQEPQAPMGQSGMADVSQLRPGPYTSAVQEPGSYGAFDYERPVSSSFNQSAGQRQQWYTLRDSQAGVPIVLQGDMLGQVQGSPGQGGVGQGFSDADQASRFGPNMPGGALGAQAGGGGFGSGISGGSGGGSFGSPNISGGMAGGQAGGGSYGPNVSGGQAAGGGFGPNISGGQVSGGGFGQGGQAGGGAYVSNVSGGQGGGGYGSNISGGQAATASYGSNISGGQVSGGGFGPGGQAGGSAYVSNISGGQGSGGYSPNISGGQAAGVAYGPGGQAGRGGGFGPNMSGGQVSGGGFGPNISGDQPGGGGYGANISGGQASGGGYGPGGQARGGAYGPGAQTGGIGFGQEGGEVDSDQPCICPGNGPGSKGRQGKQMGNQGGTQTIRASQEAGQQAPEFSERGNIVCTPPLCFSTPQYGGMSGGSPQRPGRKPSRETQRPGKDNVRRRLDLEDTEEDTDKEGKDSRVRCRCLERMKRYKKRRICIPCDYEMEYPQCPQPRYYYPCY